MTNKKYTNQLIKESSPYLLQHAHNPVNWYPWGNEALNKAQSENKLLLVSIGYSACHWCHVMEHESFENENIAQIMNEHFVCIKVDREERPDIDHIYMNAVQLMTGRGGWPLNCFAMPDGKPVYGGTYFQPDQWKDLLKNIALSYKNEPQKFEKAAIDLKNGIKSLNIVPKIKEKTDFTYEDIIDIILKLRKGFDHKNGGTWGAPKFPMPVSYFPLLRFYYHSGDKDILNHVFLSLDKMAKGGIYDHLGGGFARYSVDKEWLVPHFEKMLYDNAQLVSLYSEAYRINPNEEYKRVVTETLEFIEREMRSPEGGFYSSYDADSDREEGKYYVWDKYEVDMLLKEGSDVFSEYYDISKEGNWEGRNILNIKISKNDFAENHGFKISALDKDLLKSKKILFDQRQRRTKPGLDDKILTSWNALMMKAFAQAFQVFHEDKYLKIAEQNFAFIKKNLLKDDFSLLRNYKDQKSTIHAFLDDYTLLVDALIELYQATFKENYLITALNITEYIIKHFYDPDSGMFFYTSNNNSNLIAKTIETNDHVIPSSNSIMANNLFKLGHFFLKTEYINMAVQMLVNMKDQILKNPTYFGNWFDLMVQIVHKPFEVCIVGSNSMEIKKEFSKHYLPDILLAGGNEGKIPLLENRLTSDKTTIYVCKNNVCHKPVKSFAEALNLLNER